MRPIRQLPPAVINKIAAGEVIERPSSAVKEMLENSVDAGARHVTVELLEGGRDLIRIVDDGHGIRMAELPLAVSPHATSKLEDADDLFRVQTLGFRGEALSSIAGVSDFRLLSRPADQETGAVLEVRQGILSEPRQCACPQGTQIEVRNLFASVPVRRKFLKSKQTELGHVTEAMTRVALARPGISLRLVHNERVVLERPADADVRETIRLLFGKEVADGLLAIESEIDGVRVGGFVVDPSVDRSTSQGQYLFVNGRYFRDRSLGHALTEAYRGLLMTGRYPVTFVFVEVAPDQVDVNVHPTKVEVRFLEPHRIYSQLLSAVRTRFLASDLTAKFRAPTAKPGAEASQAANGTSRDSINRDFALASKTSNADQAALWPDDRRPWTPPAASPSASTSAPAARAGNSLAGNGLAPHQSPIDDPRIAGGSLAPPALRQPSEGAPPASRVDLHGARGPILPMGRIGLADAGEFPASSSVLAASDGELPVLDDRRAIAATTAAVVPQRSMDHSPEPVGPRALQLHNSYLVVEAEDGMLLIDQHALHERILYEQLRLRLAEQAIEVQELLIPEPVELSPTQVGVLLEHRAILASVGIRLEEFGQRCILVQSFPRMLRKLSPESLLEEIAARLEETGRAPTHGQLVDELLHLMACKAAVKAGDNLSPAEVDELLRQRHLVEDSHHCPHGRPTILRFTLQELEKQFKRT